VETGISVLGFLGIFWASFLIGFSGALVPGPVLTVTIKEAGRRGPWAGPLVVLGHGITEIAITVALILGLSAILNDPRTKAIVAMVGGGFLIFMGVSMLIRLRSLEEEMAGAAEQPSGGSKTPILLGMTTTLSNPYWFGWWGTIGASLVVTSSSLGWWGVVAFVTGHVSSDLAWYTLVSVLVSLGLSYSRGLWYKVTFGVCGGFLVAVGIGFVVYALRMGGVW
jgi:threonine/homoserine/homoserine lactone efflux protein